LDSEFAVLAGGILLARAFCEVVIVGQLNRWPADILTIYRARDVCYGLFSYLFVFAMLVATPRKADKDADPWEVDDRISARLAREERDKAVALQTSLQKSLDGWPAEAHRRLKERLEARTESGTKSAPDITVVLSMLRDEVRQESSAGRSDSRLRQGKLDHLDRMEEASRDWVPVYKWDGRPDGGDAALGDDAAQGDAESADRVSPVSQGLKSPWRTSRRSPAFKWPRATEIEE